MKFDKSKILTCVTAFQATVGMSGWFSDNLMDLEDQIKSNSPKGVISEIYTMRAPNRFVDEDTTAWNLFYPAPEPTYAERQAEWVKENGVKEGTEVRVTRKWSYIEECCCIGYGPMKAFFIGDKTCTVGHVDDREGTAGIAVYSAEEDDWWYFPYFVLEVVKEPTYRPYNNDELNDLVGEILTNKKSGRRKLVTGKPTASEGVNLDGSYITAKDLLASFYRNTDKPCGVREEA